MVLLAELSGETPTTIGFVISVGTLVVGAVTATITARVSQGAAIKELRDDQRKCEADGVARDQRIKDLELYRARQEGLAEANAPSASQARGTKPYRR